MSLWHVYHPTHGPKVWPWWRIVSVSIVRCTHDPAELFWITPISFNVWLYTRWGALCGNYRHRRGIYDSERWPGGASWGRAGDL